MKFYFLLHCFLLCTIIVTHKVDYTLVYAKQIGQKNKAAFIQKALSSSTFSSGDTYSDPWKLIKEEDEIKVFVKDNPNGYESLRITLSMQGSLNGFRNIVNDVKKYPLWVYKCSSASRLSKADDENLRYRVTTDFPFPFKDRELTVISRQWVEGSIFYSKSSAVNSADQSDNYTPIEHFESSWQVKESKGGMLDIVHEVTTEPGGEIPAWLYNMAVYQGPFQTMKNLKELVEKTSVSIPGLAKNGRTP